MPATDAQDLADALVDGARRYIDAAIAPLLARVAALEARPPVAGEPGPPGKDGRDGLDGASADVIASMVMSAIVRPKDGKDGAPGRDGLDGKDASPEAIADAVATAMAARPPPRDGKDGVGVAGAVIDRGGELVLTLSDGSLRPLGLVVGKDADMEALAAIVVGEIAKIPRPRDGIDGLGFDDLSVVHDGERAVTFRFARGDHVKEFPLTIPAIIDRGIWRENTYAKGDGVTWEGSFFVAQCDTEGKPLVSPDWRQAVKAGRPGKNTETVKLLPATVKLPGQDPSGDESAS